MLFARKYHTFSVLAWYLCQKNAYFSGDFCDSVTIVTIEIATLL